jgi:L-aspartate oxidase
MNAQGGIAVAMNAGDQVNFHVEDTIKAGAGICDEAAVKVMVEEGIDRIRELVSWGARFDKHGGKLVFTIEAAHSMRRIIHAGGDATGEETEGFLIRKAKEIENVQFMDRKFVVDLLTLDGRCFGAIMVDERNSALLAVIARATILASGGLSQIYRYTTNPDVATGDGYAIAYRAGCQLTDMEFVQFHPTTLCVSGAPRFLISEAVRGEGAILVNSRGERFMETYHERKELAPRDVVSRAVAAETERTDSECVFLDLRHLNPALIKRRFPTINERLRGYDIDMCKELIPVQASAHFMMGGVKTNLRAETNIRGLYACGEVACTGVHGANRLASNSLLETLVFSVRAASAAAEDINTKIPDVILRMKYGKEREEVAQPDMQAIRDSICNLMWDDVGIVRNAETLKDALARLPQYTDLRPAMRSGFELQNMLEVSLLVTDAALVRQESRGAHYRSDYPERDDVHWHKHITFQRTTDDDPYH